MDGTEELVVEGVEGAEGAKELVGEDGVEGTEDGICGGEFSLRHDKLKSGSGSFENYSRTVRSPTFRMLWSTPSSYQVMTTHSTDTAFDYSGRELHSRNPR
jgi:hypothetical protein